MSPDEKEKAALALASLQPKRTRIVDVIRDLFDDIQSAARRGIFIRDIAEELGLPASSFIVAYSRECKLRGVDTGSGQMKKPRRKKAKLKSDKQEKRKTRNIEK